MKKNKKIMLVSIAFVALCSFKLIDNIITKIGMKEEWVRREAMNFLLENDELNISGSIDNTRYPAYANEYRKFGEKDARTYMYNNGRVPYWLRDLKEYVTTNNKTETAKELCVYLKNYVESDLFATKYQQIRQETKPKTEDVPNQDAINYFKENNPKFLKDAETELANIKKRGGKSDIDRMMLPVYEGLVRKHKLEAKINAELKPRYNLWILAYPEDPAIFIKKRLEEYLDFAGTVDFKATTIQKGRFLVFSNADYEKKSRQWKAVYRAGADANKVVTDFIKQWLKDGIKINSTHMDDPAPAQISPKKTESSNSNTSTSNSNSSKAEPSATEAPAAEKPKKEKAIDKAKGLLKKKLF
jgi:hypothetical protein